MSMTIGAAIGAAAKGIFMTIASLTIPQALAVGAFVGAAAYTIYLRLKRNKKVKKAAKKPRTVTDQINFDKLDEDLEEIRTRDERETERIYKNILDEIDEEVQSRNRGRNHKYGKKSKKKDFAAVDAMKRRDKRRRNGQDLSMQELFDKTFAELDSIIEAEKRKKEKSKFDTFLGEDDDFSDEAFRVAAEDMDEDELRFARHQRREAFA